MTTFEITVKGTEREAKDAARAHGMSPLRVTTVLSGSHTTLLWVRGERDTLDEWYRTETPAVRGYGFCAGTLLAFKTVPEQVVKEELAAEQLLEAARLAQTVINIIESGKFPESAIWRLVDAAGLVAESLSPDMKQKLIGLTSPTGRGYQLTRRDA